VLVICIETTKYVLAKNDSWWNNHKIHRGSHCRWYVSSS